MWDSSSSRAGLVPNNARGVRRKGERRRPPYKDHPRGTREKRFLKANSWRSRGRPEGGRTTAPAR
eukprot:12417463-Karenia_brevis.AAC.1